ncbi:2-octaprenyl-6-methoxyphenol hydroxylase [Candidatus Profftia lariciata]|uniref:2-octaprenyl-6-methoxyphenyl hydroxylase n=1 Tax=Candidatus Profftia lariciata TaxID=1987921 RepID=UPI001D0344A7|nr:2-octaprenyl-6-methoxyphenyl hydroxylase [Candidatus Profftia lariciata]UDG81405.1 2-octaprenyl-6-methoxyphenol hydroxylase [Candidatus Profftia lariciata]
MKIIIVGEGMAGMTLALAVSILSSGRIQIEIVNTISTQKKEQVNFDTRAIALAYGTCEQLKQIGIWQDLQIFATPIKNIYVSDQGGVGWISIRSRDYKIPYLGQVVEIYKARTCFLKLLQKAPGVQSTHYAQIVKVIRQKNSASIQLDNGTVLTGELLVAADGSYSILAQNCHIHYNKTTYDQIAVITNLITAYPHHNKAFERFTCYGPFAMLPLSEGRCSLAWCYPVQEQVDSWNDIKFIHNIQQIFGWILGKIIKIDKRYYYPLELIYTHQHISHRLALIGNAAQTLHPIAGQGFNLGLRDVMSLAEIIVQAEIQGYDIGSYKVLSQYQKRRRPDQQATISVTDGLIHIFSNRLLPFVIGRNLGMIAMTLIPQLRETLIRRALGWVKR